MMNVSGKKVSVLLATALTALAMGGCANNTMSRQQTNTAIGAGTGAVLGGIVGKALGDNTTSTVTGAAVGAAVGGAVGHEWENKKR